MSPALNGSTALQRFERSNAVEICNGMFDFYSGPPHINCIQDGVTYHVMLQSNHYEVHKCEFKSYCSSKVAMYVTATKEATMVKLVLEWTV